jgi:hypothetical protein
MENKQTKRKVEPRKVEPKKTKSKKVRFSKVVENLEQKRPRIIIKRNAYGQYEHIETGFIFDPCTEAVVGKHVGKGKIENLSSEDLKIVFHYNFVLKKI